MRQNMLSELYTIVKYFETVQSNCYNEQLNNLKSFEQDFNCFYVPTIFVIILVTFSHEKIKLI